MNSPLLLSVVLPTYRRAVVLSRTLRYLREQTLDPHAYEVIVIDDGSNDDTEAVVREAIAQAPHRMTYLRHDNAGPGYTQNRGIREASAPLILLLADDIFLVPGALDAHVAAHANHAERSSAILGNVLQSPELPQTAFQRKWDPFEFCRLEPGQEVPYWMFWACNISVKRDFMLEHGMFLDARGSAGAAAHEDVEVGHRLSGCGLRIFHEKAALGYHYHAESLQSAIARSHERGLNWQEMFQRMPNTELLIRSRLFDLRTLIQWRREVTRERSRHLFERDRSLTHLAAGAIVRAVLFNKAMVFGFWMPLMNLAERNRVIAKLMHPRFYRNVILYHFRAACRHGRDVSGATRAMSNA